MANTLVGIDIGTYYTKVVELEHKAKPSVSGAFLFPTPYQTLAGGKQQIDAKAFLNQISNFIPSNGLRNVKIAINISTSNITALSLVLPVMDKKELPFAAIYEARRKMIPPTDPNHIFECFPLGQRIIAKLPRYEVLVIRTEKVYIQESIDLFKDINTAPALIVPNCCVLPNIIPKDAWSKDEDAIFVDIGASSINISICREGKLVFTRNVVYGFHDIVQDLSPHLNLKEDQTNNLLKELGVPQVPFDFKDKAAIFEEIKRQKNEESQKPPAADKPLVNLLELRLLWQPHLERIIHELRRSLVYYKEQSEGRRIEQIYFLGGGVQTKNIFAALIDQIGGHCQIIQPFKGMPISREKGLTDEAGSTAIFTNAACLALAIPAESMKQKTINFLPLELKRKEINAARRLVLLFVEICLIFVFTLASLHTFIANYSLRTSIKRTEFDLNRVKRVVGRLKDLGQKERVILGRIPQVEKLSKQRPNTLAPLQELARIIPREILLTKLVFSKGKVKVDACVFATYEQASNIIEDFQRQLESARYFRKANITPLKLEKVSPEVTGMDEELRLTQTQVRNFTVTIEVATK